MKEKIVCGLSIFFLADRAIMPTEANIPAGFTISVEPVEVFDYHDREAFVAALWQALQRGNPSVPDPPREEVTRDASGFPVFKNPIELKYSGINSWQELERLSIYASVAVYEAGYAVEVFGRAANGAWGEELALSARVPIEEGLHGVVDLLCAHINGRNDLKSD